MLFSVNSVSASNTFRQQVRSLLRVFQIVEREYSSRTPRSGSSDAYRPHRRVKDRDPYAFTKAYDSRVVKEPGFSNFIYEERMRSMGARAQPEVALPRQLYDYFLVLDFEATCDRDAPPHPQVGSTARSYASSIKCSCIWGHFCRRKSSSFRC